MSRAVVLNVEDAAFLRIFGASRKVSKLISGIEPSPLSPNLELPEIRHIPSSLCFDCLRNPELNPIPDSPLYSLPSDPIPSMRSIPSASLSAISSPAVPSFALQFPEIRLIEVNALNSPESSARMIEGSGSVRTNLPFAEQMRSLNPGSPGKEKMIEGKKANDFCLFENFFEQLKQAEEEVKK